MNIDPDAFRGREGMEALDHFCRERAAAGDTKALRDLLLTRANGTYEKHEVPRVVAAALIRMGVEGVQELAALIKRAPGAIYPGAILEALWFADSGARPLPVSSLGINYPSMEVSAKTRKAARGALDDLIVRAQTEGDLLDVVVGLQQQSSLVNVAADRASSPTAFSARVMQVIRDSSIVLTDALIAEFATLVESGSNESHHQDFLERHPVFLDPLAAEVFNRKRLGLELITDFVIRRHDSRYVVVEIEKPQDALFTGGGDFTAGFTHAIGQVLDFQSWVSSNVAYAQRHLPHIDTPAGLLIMGTRASMSDDQQAKLRRWCTNSRYIEVITFDDLVARARSLHASLRRQLEATAPA